MLVVVEPHNAEAVKKIFDKWDLPAVVLGVVTDDGMVKLRRNGVQVANVPAESFALGAGAIDESQFALQAPQDLLGPVGAPVFRDDELGTGKAGKDIGVDIPELGLYRLGLVVDVDDH